MGSKKRFAIGGGVQHWLIEGDFPHFSLAVFQGLCSQIDFFLEIFFHLLLVYSNHRVYDSVFPEGVELFPMFS